MEKWRRDSFQIHEKVNESTFIFKKWGINFKSRSNSRSYDTLSL